jgi:PAS domain S-box-containing protein/diguanylate cyclase (GGDEF)-like protein/putative nucleotidyltransferase with HDIG domain
MKHESDLSYDYKQEASQLDKLLGYVVEHMRGSVAVHDRNMRYVYVSEKYLQEYDIEGQDIIGRHHYDVFPDLPQKWRDAHKRAMQGEVISSDEDPFFRANGNLEYARWECRPWFELDGSVGGIIVYTELITQQKRISDELRVSRERYKSIFDNSPIAIALIESETGRYIEVNEEHCRITGRTAEELVNMRWQDLTYSDDIELDEQYMTKLRSKEIDKFSIKKRYVKSDGEIIWVSITVSDYYQSNRKCHLAMIIDINEEMKRQAQVDFLSSHDALTGLFNRKYAEDFLTAANENNQMPLVLMMLDVNGLKLINDAFGQGRGDSLLVTVAEIIRGLELPFGSVAVRLGGDEFAIIMPQTSDHEAEIVRQKLIEAVGRCDMDEVVLSVSAGYAATEIILPDVYELYRQAEDRMNRYKLSEGSSMRSRTIDLIMNSLLEKNQRELAHSRRVSEISVQIAHQLELPMETVRKIRIAGLMHDIGKIGIPDSVLNKPARLNPEEWNEIKKHSEKGYKILSSANEFSEIADYVLQHHKHWDGSGYPQGLSGDHIKLEARIIALADAYDAMTSDRSYREAMDANDAKEEISRCSGSQFDPLVAQAFLSMSKDHLA